MSSTAFSAVVHAAQRLNPNDIKNTPSFLSAPPSGQSFQKLTFPTSAQADPHFHTVLHGCQGMFPGFSSVATSRFETLAGSDWCEVCHIFSASDELPSLWPFPADQRCMCWVITLDRSVVQRYSTLLFWIHNHNHIIVSIQTVLPMQLCQCPDTEWCSTNRIS